MRLPKNFKIKLNKGIYFRENGILDMRVGMFYPYHAFNKEDIKIINNIKNGDNYIKLQQQKVNHNAAYEDWIRHFKELYKLDLFYISSPYKVINLFINNHVYYDQIRLKMLTIFITTILLVTVPIIISMFLIFSITKLDIFVSICLFIIIFIGSLILHEVSHCVSYWFLSKEKYNGYFLLEKGTVYFVSNTINTLKDRIVALAGPLTGSLVSFIAINIISHSSIYFWLVPLYHLMQILPFFHDGKIIFGGKHV
ncbi:hypothetical protein ACQCT5_19075 [Sutcliffiella halmapala]